jgi:ATP-dependent protease ClpP protease subunit
MCNAQKIGWARAACPVRSWHTSNGAWQGNDVTEHRLVFNGMIYEKQSNALRHRVAAILERSDFGSLTIVFSSDGGSTDEGFALYNFIRALPVPIHMHAAGHVGSMAVPVFLAGHERTCSPYARFFFHAYDWEFEGTQMSDRIAEALKRLNSDIDLSREIAARHTKLPKERLLRLYATNPDPTIFTPQEAKRFAIVDDIVELNPKGENQDDVALWTVGW